MLYTLMVLTSSAKLSRFMYTISLTFRNRRIAAILSLVLFLLILVSITISASNDANNGSSIRIYDQQDQLGMVESYSLLSGTVFSAGMVLKDLLPKVGLTQIKSIDVPNGTVAVIYSTKELENLGNTAFPKTIIQGTDDLTLPYMQVELPNIDGGYSILVESVLCDPPCSTHGGLCMQDKEGSSICMCASGYAGDSCDVCKPNRYGKTCKACPIAQENIGINRHCDDGVHGTGKIVCNAGIEDTYLCKSCATGYYSGDDGQCELCECGNFGKCIDNSGTCECVFGLTSKNGKPPCQTCVEGTYKTSAGCEACWEGCKNCEDKNGTCLICHKDYYPDPKDKRKCIAKSLEERKCADGEYLSNDACKPCPAECSTCYDENRCAQCSDPDEVPFAISLKNGTLCGKIDKNDVLLRCIVEEKNKSFYTPSSSPITSTSQISFINNIYSRNEPTLHKRDAVDQVNFGGIISKNGIVEYSAGLYNVQKNICEMCLTGCETCMLKENAKLDVEDENYTTKLLENSNCINCINDYSNLNINGINVCRKSKCSNSDVRNSNGLCVNPGEDDSYVERKINLWHNVNDRLSKLNCNGNTYISLFEKCVECHPDCNTCVGPRFSSCSSCRAGLFLEDNRCVRYCPKGKIANQETRKCETCSSKCEVCSNNDNCIMCKSGHKLENGSCYKMSSVVNEQTSLNFKWVGYTCMSLVFVFTISTGLMKAVYARKVSARSKYDNWSQRTADSRVSNLVSVGALDNIGINANDIIKLNNGQIP